MLSWEWQTRHKGSNKAILFRGQCLLACCLQLHGSTSHCIWIINNNVHLSYKKTRNMNFSHFLHKYKRFCAKNSISCVNFFSSDVVVVFIHSQEKNDLPERTFLHFFYHYFRLRSFVFFCCWRFCMFISLLSQEHTTLSIFFLHQARSFPPSFRITLPLLIASRTSFAIPQGGTWSN
jgi:hypothetical protein